LPVESDFNTFIESNLSGKIIDMQNPDCVDCNECCSMGTVLSDDEFNSLSRFLRKDKLGKVYFELGVSLIMRHMSKGTFYWMCAFSDNNKKCRIYKKRPLICRQFHCDEGLRSNEYKKVEGSGHKTIWDLFEKEVSRYVKWE
jgi:Fe-S-cluster containining protein